MTGRLLTGFALFGGGVRLIDAALAAGIALVADHRKNNELDVALMIAVWQHVAASRLVKTPIQL